MLSNRPGGIRQVGRPNHAPRPGKRPIDMSGMAEICAHQRFDLLMRFGRVETHRPRELFLQFVREDVGVIAGADVL